MVHEDGSTGEGKGALSKGDTAAGDVDCGRACELSLAQYALGGDGNASTIASRDRSNDACHVRPFQCLLCMWRQRTLNFCTHPHGHSRVCKAHCKYMLKMRRLIRSAKCPLRLMRRCAFSCSLSDAGILFGYGNSRARLAFPLHGHLHHSPLTGVTVDV